VIPDNICYTIANDTTIYTYPGLSCVDGSSLPLFNGRVRDTYILLNNGKYYKTLSTTNVNNITSTTTSIAHLWSSNWYNQFNPEVFVLPSTLIMLCFFSLVLKMFKGLKR
jgi:hypothetical protein